MECFVPSPSTVSSGGFLAALVLESADPKISLGELRTSPREMNVGLLTAARIRNRYPPAY